MKTKKLFRNYQVRQEDVNIEARTVELSFSSEEPVERWFGTEILDHKSSSVDMERLNNGAPFLVNHSIGDLAGVVKKGKVDTKEKKGRATIQFGSSERATEIMNDMAEGVRPNISVGYIVKKFEKSEEDGKLPVFRATKWMPLEISSVPIPADNTVGVGREEIDEYETSIVDERGEEINKEEIIEEKPKEEVNIFMGGKKHSFNDFIFEVKGEQLIGILNKDVIGIEKPKEEETSTELKQLTKNNKNLLVLKEKQLSLLKFSANNTHSNI